MITRVLKAKMVGGYKAIQGLAAYAAITMAEYVEMSLFCSVDGEENRVPLYNQTVLNAWI